MGRFYEWLLQWSEMPWTAKEKRVEEGMKIFDEMVKKNECMKKFESGLECTFNDTEIWQSMRDMFSRSGYRGAYYAYHSELEMVHQNLFTKYPNYFIRKESHGCSGSYQWTIKEKKKPMPFVIFFLKKAES